MLLDTLVDNIFSALAIFTVFFWGHTLLLLQSLRLYNKRKDYPISYESGFIIDAVLKKDLNSEKNLLKRYAMLYFMTIVILLLVNTTFETWQFAIYYGIMLFLIVNSFFRSAKQFLFHLKAPTGVEGKILFKTWFSLFVIGIDDIVSALVFLLFYLVSGKALFLGGVISSIAMAARNLYCSQKSKK